MTTLAGALRLSRMDDTTIPKDNAGPAMIAAETRDNLLNSGNDRAQGQV